MGHPVDVRSGVLYPQPFRKKREMGHALRSGLRLVEMAPDGLCGFAGDDGGE